VPTPLKKINQNHRAKPNDESEGAREILQQKQQPRIANAMQMLLPKEE
jgi:hypothetical protein